MHAILENLDQLLNDLFPFLINYIRNRIFKSLLWYVPKFGREQRTAPFVRVYSDCSSELGNHRHSNLKLKLSMIRPLFILAFLNLVNLHVEHLKVALLHSSAPLEVSLGQVLA